MSSGTVGSDSGSRRSATGITTSRSSCLSALASTIVTSRSPPPRNLAISADRSLGGRQPDALDRLLGQRLQPLQRQRQVRAALRPGDGVDLIDDQRLDVAEGLARPRGQHQVERLRRRDQDVGRVAQHRRAFLLRRVAGADADRDLVGALDRRQRHAQVALDVVAERLQRRDVDRAHALALGARPAHQPVDRPEEGGECLARSGRRADQRVIAGRDRRPTLGLRRRRLTEGAVEPGADLGREAGQRIGGHPKRLAVDDRPPGMRESAYECAHSSSRSSPAIFLAAMSDRR